MTYILSSWSLSQWPSHLGRAVIRDQRTSARHTARHATYTLNDSWGTDAHTIGVHVGYVDLPAAAQAAIAAEPDAAEWRIPSPGAEDELILVILRE